MQNLIERREEVKAQLWADFLLFIQTFFPIITGREFHVSQPSGRESHFLTVARALTQASSLKALSQVINMPPGYGKSTMVSYWVAWTLSRWPDSQFLYISYGMELATKHTETIRRIINSREYRDLFDIEIRGDSKAKDSFQTKQGGSIKAFGSSGPITGQDAGLPNCDRFTGALIMDDMHKPDEVHSDTIRERVINNYRETILQRPRGPNVPFIFIGQCLHEADLAAFFRSGQDERKWNHCVLKALDDAGNALYPEVNDLANLLEKKDKNPYVFASQYQQDPIPAGGALFKQSYFPILSEEPEILLTFITADTAETDKTYNDATVFSFFGLYKIKEMGFETGQIGLHWLDCMEVRIEPKDLRNEFMIFYQGCMHHKVKPLIAAIEKKSTGVTLVSTLEEVRGLRIIDIERNRASGSKTTRFLEIQPILAAKLVSFTQGARHVDLCINHMVKITANSSHRFDDVADTVSDACKLALIDKVIKVEDATDTQRKMVLAGMSGHFNKVQVARGRQQFTGSNIWN
jgi:predicted phage terminase large subunit-like protein